MRRVKLENRMSFTRFLPFNSVCAEFGVFRGLFSQEILLHLKPRRLYLVDPYWRKYGDRFWNDKGTMDTWKCAVKRIRKFDTNNVATLVVDTDYNFLPDLPDGFFDWIYLDSTHTYEDTLREMEIIPQKVKDDGLITGHDWNNDPRHKHFGVNKAVTEWLQKNPEYHLYLRDNHHQWIIKRKDTVIKRNISFCTTCMNRLDDLRVTLPVNIEANADYPNLEFVLLDYNSSDGLGHWVKKEMMEHIRSGRLVYYRLENQEYFNMCYSRNIAFKLASGEIVNNLDADNFTFETSPNSLSWAAWLNEQAEINPFKTIFIKSRQLGIIHGRIGFHKEAFLDLGGYDEDLTGYGHDDQNIVERALASGFILSKWGGRYFSRIQTGTARKNTNLLKHWKITRRENKALSAAKIARKEYIANVGREWGKATVVKNFKEEVRV